MLFLSYSTKDEAFVKKLEKRFSDLGLRYWLDKRRIKVGDDIHYDIYEGIEKSSFMIYVISENSLNSDWCKDELSAGRVKQKQKKGFNIFPILISNVDIPLYLKTVRYLDMRNWKKRKDFNKSFSELLDSINAANFRVLFGGHKLSEPTSITCDGRNLFICDLRGSLFKFSLNGRLIKQLKGLNKPHCCKFINSGQLLYVADTYNDRILTTDKNFSLVQEMTLSHKLNHPHAIDVDHKGHLYIVDTDSHSILKVDSTGNVIKKAGRAGGLPGSMVGHFNTPCGLHVSSNLIIVADTYNDRITAMDLELNPFVIEIDNKETSHLFRTPVSVLRTGPLLFVANENKKRGLQIWNLFITRKKIRMHLAFDNILNDISESVFGLTKYESMVYATDRAAPKVFSANINNIPKL